MMLERDDSLLVVKTLIIRGANIDTLTNNDETCIDLIPEEMIDEDKHGKLNKMLTKHRCICPATLTFRYLTIKYVRSRKTMCYFVFALLALAYTHLTIVIPSKLKAAIFQ